MIINNFKKTNTYYDVLVKVVQYLMINKLKTKQI